MYILYMTPFWRVVANRKAFFGEQAVLVLVVLVRLQGFYNFYYILSLQIEIF